MRFTFSTEEEACSGRCRERDGTGRLRLRRRSVICEPISSSATYGSHGRSAIASRSSGSSDLYEERRRIGSNTRGYPLKLGLNSLYGKMAQRCGRGPYHDVVSAGLITAITRARLIEAIGQDPHSVVMVATDAVFSTRPLSLDIGERLGQWEEKVWPDLFIAQPGVYWSPSDLEKSVKSRGAPRSVIGPAAPRFHEVFAEWLRSAAPARRYEARA